MSSYEPGIVPPLQTHIIVEATPSPLSIQYDSIDADKQYSPVTDTTDTISEDNDTNKVYVSEYDVEKQASTTDVETHYDETEKQGAAAALRTSTWINTFFLITTDILGPSNAPFSISTLGYVPGAIIYFIFGMAAMYTGLILQRLYLALDNEQQPIRTYSDIGERIFDAYGPVYGKIAKYVLAFFQTLQQLFSVAIIILGNASGLNEIVGVASPVGSNVCFLALSASFMGMGFIVGQIKTFNGLAQFANTCIWLNLFVAFGTVAVASVTTPMWGDNRTDMAVAPGGLFVMLPGIAPFGPVQHNISASYDWTIAVQGIMNMCYAYAGANMFVEFMAEMKDPREFFKAQMCAQTLIICCYMIFGMLMYYYQGQYVANPANQGIRPYSWQTAFNAIGLYTAIIAAVMYGNIGMKVFYISVGMDLLNAPALHTRKGTWLWRILVIAFWSLAWVLAEAIPIFGDLVSITAAACVLQYTYTFPPLFQLCYELQQDVAWKDTFTRRWYLKAFDATLFAGSLGVMGIGLYSSVSTLIVDIQAGLTTPFGCTYV